MKALVTGSPGWLGDTLVDVLLKKGCIVRCLVLEGMDISRLKEKNVEIVVGDITKRAKLSEATKGIDIVFHCAGIIHPQKISHLYSINYIGTKNILDESIKSYVKKFVYISSNSPMGTNRRRHVLMKEDDSYNPYKHYGKSKKLAEDYVNRAFQHGKINTVILRPCWFYGPNQPPRQTTFFKMIKKGNPIVFGDGNNLRSMTYIENAVEGIILAGEKDIANGQNYWIADERPYPTIEIYETVAELLNVKLKPRYLPKFVSSVCEITDDLLQSFGYYNKEIHVAGEMDKDIAVSIEKAKKELNYNPKIDLREGMKRSIEWCRKEKLL